jgi:hypothetical protein
MGKREREGLRRGYGYKGRRSYGGFSSRGHEDKILRIGLFFPIVCTHGGDLKRLVLQCSLLTYGFEPNIQNRFSNFKN